MAKVVNPLLSVEARGRLAGLIYNTWRGIATVKAFSSPNQPNTPEQLAARTLLSDISKDWAGLSTAQRAGWSAYADAHTVTDWTGNPKRLTGMNWFVGCNVNIARCGESAITAAPAAASPDAPAGLALANDAGDITLAWTAPVAATSFIDVRHYGPASAGLDARQEQARFLIMPGADEVSPVEILLAAAKGTHTFWVRTLDSLTGLASTWTKLSIAIA